MISKFYKIHFKMNSPQEIDSISFIFIVISSVGFLLGIITILSFMSDAFYNFNCWFFAISLISQFLCLYECYKDSNIQHPPPLNFNPYFHNAISFFTFATTWTASIFYIIDTSILHLSTLIQFLPKCDIKTSLDKFLKSKSTMDFSSTIELLVLPELLIWLIVVHKFGILISMIIYVFNILMFGYAYFDPLTRKFKSIYKSLKKQYNSSDDVTKSILGIIISISDSLSNISSQIYKITAKTYFSS